jgi:transcriptional regulator with PAS, ATPase and Fis domain
MQLVVFFRDAVEHHVVATGCSVTVGRDPDCDIAIDRATLSRKHFRVEGGPQPSVRDLGSTNGTTLDGVKVAPGAAVPLVAGGLIEAAGLLFVLRDAASHTEPSGRLESVVVEDPAMQRLHDLAGAVAQSRMSVLVVGETGVGKEILANALHGRSPRAGMRLVRVNCAALPESLLESELFGHEKGAFTGASQSKAGLLESSDGGTFFLDEIGEMPLSTQAKLLRVLEGGELTRLGGLRPRPIDVRFVAATNAHLPTLVSSGAFRRDLYYRINGITLAIPPLRDRPTEIASLARAFVVARARLSSRLPPAIAPGAVARLEGCTWPGNVRQLRNVMDRALAVCRGPIIQPEHILLDAPVTAPPPRASAAPPATPPPPPRGLMRADPLEDRLRLISALEQANGHQGRAAEILGVSRRTLMNWLDAHHLPRPRKSPRASSSAA